MNKPIELDMLAFNKDGYNLDIKVDYEHNEVGVYDINYKSLGVSDVESENKDDKIEVVVLKCE